MKKGWVVTATTLKNYAQETKQLNVHSYNNLHQKLNNGRNLISHDKLFMTSILPIALL